MPVSFQRCWSSRNLLNVWLSVSSELTSSFSSSMIACLTFRFASFSASRLAMNASRRRRYPLNCSLNFGAVEILLGAALLDEAAACGLDLGAADAVKGDLQRLDIGGSTARAALRASGRTGPPTPPCLFRRTCPPRASARRVPPRPPPRRRALDLQPGILRRERSLLIGKDHLHVPGHVLLRFRNLLPGGRLDPGTFGARRSLLAGNPLRSGLLRRRFCGGRLRHGGFRGRVRNLRNGFFRGVTPRAQSCGRAGSGMQSRQDSLAHLQPQAGLLLGTGSVCFSVAISARLHGLANIIFRNAEKIS